MNDTLPVSAEQLVSTPVVAVNAEHSFAAAWEAMRQRQVHDLVVLDDDYGIAAVLDDRTLAAGWPGGGPEAPHRSQVGELVQHGVRCVGPGELAAAVARVMTESRCDAVPVVSRNGMVLGLVTATDLVAAVAREAVVVAP
ncbi:MAG TPA: CBS domain-containing protein, partial [Mycobacteriales bacterium]